MKQVRKQERGRRRAAVVVMLLALIALAAWAHSAQAAPGCTPEGIECPPQLSRIPTPESEVQIDNPVGIATDPSNGHVFVSESVLGRIDEFDPQGHFIRAWGWGVIDGSHEAQVCTPETGCLAGLGGDGPGQLMRPGGIEVDKAGDVWVADGSSEVPTALRVQKFSPAGEFILMIGGEVNRTKVEEREEQQANSEPVTVTEAEENLCTAASGDTCKGGTSGTGDGQFKELLPVADSVAMDSAGAIYVGDRDRVQKFAANGSYLGDIALPGAGFTRALAIDPADRIYAISEGVIEEIPGEGGFLKPSRVVREIDASGAELGRLKGEWQGRATPLNPAAVAADAEGNVYVVGKVVYDQPLGKPAKPFDEVLAFDEEGNLIFFDPERAGFGRPSDTGRLTTVATNVVKETEEPGEVIVGHFNPAYLLSYGRPFKPEPKPPTVEEEFVRSVGSKDATLEALINPRFGEETSFWVQYGLGECQLGGCVETAPAPLPGGAVNSPLNTNPVSLSGLQPDTTYHYRFLAENEAPGEQPAFGQEGTFHTYRAPQPPDPKCANAALRIGLSALLPDCRAYEMVSPLDKEGGDLFVLPDIPSFPAALNQGAADGNRLSYSSYRAFADPDSAPLTSQYLARRSPDGWANESISPPREGTIVSGLETQYRAFSADLSQGWLVTDSEPVLDEGGLPGYSNIYLRDNEAGSYQAQCATPPPGLSASKFLLEPQGSSLDGSHLVFRANAKLSEDALEGNARQLYECVDGAERRLVSVLPGGEANPIASSLGTGAANGGTLELSFRYNTLATAISDDGSRIFWTATAQGPGPLYVRIDGAETLQIAAADARFRVASPDGGRVVYSVGEELREARVEPGSVTSSAIAGKVEGLMGASEDLSLLYFASEEDRDAGGPAQAGKHNLYLYRAEEESFSFIAAISGFDAQEEVNSEESAPTLTPLNNSPYNNSARVTPDGLHAAFTSTAPLTGYDNTDLNSGEEDAEVFVYDAETGELRCASCNPGGARPLGENRGGEGLPFWAAAAIPGWENSLHGSRALSEDGDRLFFEASDSLALADTNGARDVYQWEAVGKGSCSESSPGFSTPAGGCIELVSSGKSPEPSTLIDASADGRDVFFKTAASLWAPDPGLTDAYDARIGGGFPPPPPLPPACEGEACQPPSTPPARQTPASASFQGPGNAVQKARRSKRRRCRVARKAKQSKARCRRGARKSDNDHSSRSQRSAR